MITKVLDYLNNHFIRTSENLELTFDNGTSKISGSFDKTYLAGQYVYIKGSILNDGAFKITAVGTDEITIDGTLTDEVRSCYILGLQIPPSLIDLVSEIDTFNSSQSKGVSSESQGQRSVSYDSNVSVNGWKSAFKGELSEYRCITNDLYRYGGVI